MRLPVIHSHAVLIVLLSLLYGCAGAGGLVERNVTFPDANGKSTKALALIPLEIISNGRTLQIPRDAQLALTYENGEGAVIKTRGVDNDGPSIALLLAPGKYKIIGLDAIATSCPDGGVRTVYNQYFRDPIPLEIAASSVAYVGRLRVNTRCFKKFTGRTVYRQQGSQTIAEEEFFWTVEFLGAKREAAFDSDLPLLRQAYPNVAWKGIEVQDLSAAPPPNGQRAGASTGLRTLAK